MGNPQDYDKLTPKQGELLRQIVELASEAGGEPLFDYTVYVPDVGIGCSGGKFRTEWFGAVGAFDVFEELGFVVRRHRKDVGVTHFALRKKALDYPRWRSRPRWWRWLSVKWDSWESDVRGGLITIVVSVLASLAVALLTNWLF
jgi:hypothetical protein